MERSKNAGRFSLEDVHDIVYHEIGKYWLCNICQMQVRFGALSSHIDGALNQSLKTNYTASSGGDLHMEDQKIVEKTSGDQQNPSMLESEVKDSQGTSTDVSSAVENDDNKLDFLAENIVLCKNRTSSYSCITCNIIISGERKNVLEHINGKLHQKCKSITSSDYCKICLTNHPNGQHTQTVNEMEKHTAQSTVTVEMEKYQQFGSERIFFERKRWSCHICRAGIGGTEKNVIEHINGKQHQISRNTLSVPKSFWYCSICRTNHPLGQKSCSQSVFGIIDETNKNSEKKVDKPRKRKRDRMDESEKSFSEEKQQKQSKSYKLRLILDAVPLSGNSAGGQRLFFREENFMARYKANQNKKNRHLRCNFCDKMSESQLLCQIHQFSNHPVESAALKEILNSRK